MIKFMNTPLTPFERAQRAMKRRANQHYYVGKSSSKTRKVIELHPVHVVVMSGGIIQRIYSFADNVEGNRRAERIFGRLVRENQAGIQSFSPSEIYDMGGTYDDDNGYSVNIIHS